MKQVFKKLGERIEHTFRPSFKITEANDRIKALEKDHDVLEEMRQNIEKMKQLPRSLQEPTEADEIISREAAATEARIETVLAYSKLTTQERKVLGNKDISDLTLEDISRAQAEAKLRERMKAYPEGTLKLSDINKGVEWCQLRLNNIDAENAELARLAKQKALANASTQVPTGLAKNPVHVVHDNGQGYYIAWHESMCYAMPDFDSSVTVPFILAKAKTKASATSLAGLSGSTPLDYEEYKKILKAAPSYQALRSAYVACSQNMLPASKEVKFDFGSCSVLL